MKVITPQGVRVILPVTVEVQQNGLVLEKGNLLHARQRLPPDAMWWGLLIYSVHFPDVAAYRRD